MHSSQGQCRGRAMLRAWIPLAGSSWSAPGTVAGFAQSAPNAVLMAFAEQELKRADRGRALDIGCGAGRNALPLVRLGWSVVGTDLSWPMLNATVSRTHEQGLGDRLHVVLAPMEHIPVRDRSIDLVVAHGIWNLARSAAQFRRALDEAARVARPGAGLFVFTFSRNTFPASDRACGRRTVRVHRVLGRTAVLPHRGSTRRRAASRRLRARPRCSLPRVQLAEAGDAFEPARPP